MATVLALGLTACADVRLPAPETRLPKAYEGAATASPALSPQALDRWWRLYEDSQLTGLIEAALVSAPDARTALARIDQARATRAQTLSAYLPQGNLSGSAQEQHTTQSIGGAAIAAGAGSSSQTGSSSAFLTPSGDLQTYAAQFNISYELDVFGRRRVARRSADADVAAQRFDYEATRATLAREVAVDLFSARGDAIQLADARETLRIARDLARSGDLSAARGLTSTSDAARLDSDAAAAEAEAARLQALTLSDRRTLLALVGRGADPLSSLPVSATAKAPPLVPLVTPGELLRRRPDVREAELRLRSAAARLKLDRLALFPTFSLAPGGQYSKTTGTYDSDTSIWSIGLNATLPILDRPRLLAAIRGQRAVGEEAVIAYEQSVQNAYRDAENGLSALAGDRARIDRLQISVDRAHFAFVAKRRGYDLGLTDLTTLLDAERTWRTATSTLSGAQTTALVDSATLFQALGGGWTPARQIKAQTLARAGAEPKA